MVEFDTLEVSFVLPCLNEARTVASCVNKAQEFLRASGVRGEIIVADNGSTDDSQAIAIGMGARVVAVTTKGYGAALAGGIAAARGRYVIMGDADASYDLGESETILAKLREGYDLVLGNRFKGGIKDGAMPFLHRYLGNPVLSFIGRLFFKIPLGDFHCGLRGFARQSILDLDLRTTGMEYASEMIVRASLHGLRMAEVPVSLSPDGRGRPSHLNTWRDGWRHLRFLLIYSPRWLYFYPGLAMILVGMLIAGLLVPGPFMITQDVGLDVHTLLVGALAFLVGVQSLTFGMLARQYAVKLGMLPEKKVLSGITVERMLLLALIFIVAGLGGVGWATRLWSVVDFGALDYRNVMRILIVAASCIVGGLQLGFAAFMLGVMQIRQR